MCGGGQTDRATEGKIDAHGFASFCGHKLASLPSFSTNLSSDPLVLINGLGGHGRVEQEWAVFDFEGYWKVGTLRDGILKLALSDEAPGAGEVRDDNKFHYALGHYGEWGGESRVGEEGGF